MARRIGRSDKQRRRMKAEYDHQYRARLGEALAAKKREYFQRTYNPEVARVKRKARAFDHAAYCRRYYADPAKKAQKIIYDMLRRSKEYAEFAESWRLMLELEREVRRRVPDKYERQKNRGYFLKINERKRHERQDRRTA